MGGIQSGQTASQGLTNTVGQQKQTGSQSTSGTSAQNTVGTSNQNTTGTTSGSSTQNTTGQQTTTGQSQVGTQGTTQAIDTLGLGKLLQNQANAAQGATDTTNSYLSNLVANGPQQQQALTSRAVNQALSGPGMVGAGDNARARAASDAAATIAANSTSQQLQAASQLAGPTAATTLAAAGNPYVGQATTGQQVASNTGTTQSAQNTTGTTQGTSTQNTTGNTTQNQTGSTTGLNLSSLVNDTNTSTAENQSGQSSGQSAQVGVGKIPESTAQAGGCYVCTKFVDRGLMKPGAVRRAATWKLYGPDAKAWRKSLVGYSIYGPTLAKFNLVPRVIARLILWEECRLAGVRLKSRLDAKFCHWVFHNLSEFVAEITDTHAIQSCDSETSRMLRRNNLNFIIS